LAKKPMIALTNYRHLIERFGYMSTHPSGAMEIRNNISQLTLISQRPHANQALTCKFNGKTINRETTKPCMRSTNHQSGSSACI